MALFQVDGKGPTPTLAGPTYGAAAVDEHLGALLGEHILPVRRRVSTEEPYLLGVDVLGSPVVVEVVGTLDGPTLLHSLALLGRATRFSLRDLAARYHGGSDRFLPDLATFRESVPVGRGAASRGPRLLVVCLQVADGIDDAVAALDGRGVDVLRATPVDGPHGPLLDVSPVHRATPDGAWSVSHGVAALTAAGGDVTAAWRSAAEQSEVTATPMRATATGLPDSLSRSRAWRRVLDDDALERRIDHWTEPGPEVEPGPGLGYVPDVGPPGRAGGGRDALGGHDPSRPAPAANPARQPSRHPVLHHPAPQPVPQAAPQPSGPTLAGYLAPQAPQPPAPVVASTGADPALAALAARGPVRLVWVRERRNQRFEARVLPEGLVEIADGRRLADPSRAAELVSGTPGVDGWRVWRLGLDGPTLGQATRP